MAVLLLLPSAQVRGLEAPLCPASGAGVPMGIPRDPECPSKMTQGSLLVQGGTEARPPCLIPPHYWSGPPPKVPWGCSLGESGDSSNHCPFTHIDFSISLLGKPPHSSIMSMATGKNLQSIPKKVSKADPGYQGFSEGVRVGAGRPNLEGSAEVRDLESWYLASGGGGQN